MKTEVRKGFIGTVIVNELVDPKPYSIEILYFFISKWRKGNRLKFLYLDLGIVSFIFLYFEILKKNCGDTNKKEDFFLFCGYL